MRLKRPLQRRLTSSIADSSSTNEDKPPKSMSFTMVILHASGTVEPPHFKLSKRGLDVLLAGATVW